jgi:hypothetical protein
MKMAISRSRGRGDLEFVDAKPKSDAYTGLLGISLAAMIVGCVLLYLDYDQYPKTPPPTPPAPVKTPTAPQQQQPKPTTPAPATPPAGAQPGAAK